MAVDETSSRLDRLERMLGDFGSKIDRLGQNGAASSREVEKSARRIEDEFSPEELQMVRDHRGYEQFKRYVDRLGDDLDKEARIALASSDDADEDEDADGDDDAAAKPKGKAKPRGRKKPASRHADDEPDDDESQPPAPEPKSVFARLMEE